MHKGMRSFYDALKETRNARVYLPWVPESQKLRAEIEDRNGKAEECLFENKENENIAFCLAFCLRFGNALVPRVGYTKKAFPCKEKKMREGGLRK